MKCLKTGGWVHLIETQSIAYGDIHQNEQGAIICILGKERHDSRPAGVDIWCTVYEVGMVRRSGDYYILITDKAAMHFEWRIQNGGCEQVAI